MLVAGAGIVHVWLTLHLTLNTHGDGLEISVGHLTWQEQYRLGGRNEGEKGGRAGIKKHNNHGSPFLLWSSPS